MLLTPDSIFGSGVSSMKGVVIATYPQDGLQPSSILRVRTVSTEYQRKGFFRIGLLPMAVLEGVIIEVHDPQSLSNSLVQCNQCFGPRNAGVLELRDVQLVADGAITNRLVCGRARPAGGGKWELLDGVTFDSDAKRTEAPRAILHVTGPSAGQLFLETTPPSTYYFFAPSNHPKPSGK